MLLRKIANHKLLINWKKCNWYSQFSHLACEENRPKRAVFVSTSDSIFENLALEEWLYERTDFSKAEILLIWRNRPALVFGRHQNPWLEANVPFAASKGVCISRRSSGGGTVYHDEANLNLSFLTTRKRYNRRVNLDLIVDALRKKWDIDLSVNQRDDIMLDRFYKVSGTAAKLGRLQSYHHCTLLINVDQCMLKRCLDSPMIGADSKATKSTPASVMNLKDKVPDMNFELLVNVIGEHFLQMGGCEKNLQSFQDINPNNESNFPGITGILQRLQSWEWVYGKTPNFSINRTFVGPICSMEKFSLKVSINVEKGAISLTTLELENADSIDRHLSDFTQTLHMCYSENANNLKLSHPNLLELHNKCQEYLLSIVGDEHKNVQLGQWILDSVMTCFKFV
ncbi:unnamed protein product [Lymnaea stagnalis]|uniref:BPL/LPL catalytic domain-containing protein n=1 Tax=Lymnaea stagnalis TaxID=6523 RepID=A0AAV2I0V6_LYMST